MCALVLTAGVFGSVDAADAITFESVTSGHNTVASSLSLPAPATTAPGDVLVAALDVIGSPTVTAPTGWTLVRKDANAASTHMSQYIYRHTAGTAEPSAYGWGFSASEGAGGAIADYRGVDPTNPVTTSSGQSAVKSAQIVAASVSASAPAELLLGAFGYADIGSLGAPAGMTGRVVDSSSNPPGQRTTIELADQLLTATGSTGTRSVTLSQAVNWIGQLVLLQPDVTPPTAPTQLVASPTSSTITLSWQPSTDNAAVAGYAVSQGATLLANPTGTSYTVTWLSCGTQLSFAVTAYDPAGNTSPPATVTAATTPCAAPTVSVTAPGNGSTVSGTAVSLDATASSNSGAPIISVQFQLDGSNLGAARTSPPYAATWDTTGVANGPHVLTAVATDQNGATATSAPVDVTVANTAPPTITLTSPGGGATVSGTNVPISATATGPVASVQFQIDANNLGPPQTSPPYTTTWDTTTVANGPHVLTALATDTSGNTHTSAPVTVTVANGAVVVSSVGITPTAPTTTATLNATAAASDPARLPITYTYQWLLNGVPISGATSPTLDLSQPGNGDRGDSVAVTVTASDGPGTSSPVTSSPVTIVDSAPTVTVALSSRTPDTDATLTATASPSDADTDPVSLTYVWSVNGTAVQTDQTSSTTDRFDLSLPGHGNYDDSVSVTVTPNDGTLNGTPASASATVTKPATGTIVEYRLGISGAPGGITAGPDGNLWVSIEQSATVGRMTLAGVATGLPLPSVDNLGGITAGPDGNMWLAQYTSHQIGRMVPSSGALTEFTVPTSTAGFGGIVTGPDGNVWFVESPNNIVGRITTSGSALEYKIPTANSFPHSIAAGPDGNLWFAELSTNKIGRINPATGTVTEFPLPHASSSPFVITPGPDGNLWFTEEVGRIGRITPSGTITEFTLSSPSTMPTGITAGPDGNVWFAERGTDKIGRINPTTGAVTEFAVPTANAQPDKLVAGPDGNIWFTEHNVGQIGRITP
jgi:virginiamycin B lyase